jgi:3-oxoacyl-(acyl-carrier-protein) synthase
MRQVVVSGVGVVSSVGIGVEAFWQALTAGPTGLALRPDPGGSGACRVVAAVDDFCAARYIKDPRLRRVCNKAFAMLGSAAVMAWQDAAADRLTASSARVGVSVGIGPIDQYTTDLQETVAKSMGGEPAEVDLGQFVEAAHHLHPLRRLQYLPNIGAALISILHQATGPTLTFVSGVTAGLQAICAAAAMIREGCADAVICGGVDARVTPRLMPTAIEQFELSDVLDADRACRPFDRSRSGMVVGEGAVALLLERADLPGRKTAGYGTLTAWTLFGGHGHAASMRALFHRCGRAPDVVVAHGDGGIVSDAREADALTRALAAAPGATSVTSIQPAIGHTLCASGPLAAAAACLTLARQAVPPIRSLDDPIAPLSFVAGTACDRAVETVLVNCLDPDGAGGSLLFTCAS